MSYLNNQLCNFLEDNFVDEFAVFKALEAYYVLNLFRDVRETTANQQRSQEDISFNVDVFIIVFLQLVINERT